MLDSAHHHGPPRAARLPSTSVASPSATSKIDSPSRLKTTRTPSSPANNKTEETKKRVRIRAASPRDTSQRPTPTEQARSKIPSTQLINTTTNYLRETQNRNIYDDQVHALSELAQLCADFTQWVRSFSPDNPPETSPIAPTPAAEERPRRATSEVDATPPESDMPPPAPTSTPTPCPTIHHRPQPKEDPPTQSAPPAVPELPAPLPRLILRFHNAATFHNCTPHPAHIRDVINADLDGTIVTAAEITRAGQLIIHFSSQQNYDDMCKRTDELWAAIRRACSFPASKAKPYFETTQPWTKVVAHRVPLPFVDNKSAGLLRTHIRRDLKEAHGITKRSLRQIRFLCSTEELLRRAAGSTPTQPQYVTVMIALSIERAAALLLSQGVYSGGARCKVTPYRSRSQPRDKHQAAEPHTEKPDAIRRR